MREEVEADGRGHIGDAKREGKVGKKWISSRCAAVNDRISPNSWSPNLLFHPHPVAYRDHQNNWTLFHNDNLKRIAIDLVSFIRQKSCFVPTSTNYISQWVFVKLSEKWDGIITSANLLKVHFSLVLLSEMCLDSMKARGPPVHTKMKCQFN